MIRVNQAGEYGAVRIYAGQRAVLGEAGPVSGAIAGMAAQEAKHLARFDAMIAARGVRPTLLQPLWRVAGHALGVTTALISPAAALAATAAIEDEIDSHYGEQLEALEGEDSELSSTIEEFRADEQEHRDAAIQGGAQDAFLYPLLYSSIRAGCRIAIELSKRI